MKALILAAGCGTRVRPLTDNLPKPMIPVVSKPVMAFLVEHLSRFDIKQVMVNTSYLAPEIERYFGKGKLFGVEKMNNSPAKQLSLRFSTVTGAVAVILLALVGCGGGSGGDPKIAPQATKLANFNFDSFRAPIGLLSTRLIASPTTSGFTDAARTYVSIWYIDNDANRQQLAFMTMKAFQALDASGGIRLRVPANVSALAYEIYDHDSAVSGGVPL